MSARSLAPWFGVALCVHGVAFAASDRVPHVVPVVEIPMEVDLAMPAPEPTPPAAPPEEPAPEVPVAAPVQMKAAPRAVPAAPRETAARAGALLTAGEASADDDPVAFVTDPNGVSYGSGVVARGGTADHGRGPVVAPVASAAPGPSRPAGDEITPAANLSRPATLEEPDACRGFFPSEAMADDGSVDMHVIVLSSGRVSKVSIVRELPEHQGFGAAAKTCLLSKRFAPGVDKAGASVTSSAAVRVRFTR